MIYLLVCLLFILLSYGEGFLCSPKKSQFIGIMIAIILIFFAGLRTKVGTDWYSYTGFYLNGTDSVELGYALINNLFSSLKINYNLFLIVINTISLILVYFAFKKNAKLLIISFLLFYCELYLYFNFSGIRQGLAISITLFSIKYILERNLFKFLFCILLAMSFHVTSIVFIIAYFIPQKKLNIKHYVLSILFFFSFSAIIYLLKNVLTGNLAYRLIFYTELQEQADNIKHLFLIGSLKRIIIIVMIFIFGRGILKQHRIAYYFNVYLFGFGMYLTTYLISPDLGARLSSYFLIFDVLLAANLVLVNKSLSKRLIIITLFSLVALYKIYTYMILDTYDYHSILTLK